jgi:hypothetical protein
VHACAQVDLRKRQQGGPGRGGGGPGSRRASLGPPAPSGSAVPPVRGRRASLGPLAPVRAPPPGVGPSLSHTSAASQASAYTGVAQPLSPPGMLGQLVQGMSRLGGSPPAAGWPGQAPSLTSSELRWLPAGGRQGGPGAGGTPLAQALRPAAHEPPQQLQQPGRHAPAGGVWGGPLGRGSPAPLLTLEARLLWGRGALGAQPAPATAGAGAAQGGAFAASMHALLAAAGDGAGGVSLRAPAPPMPGPCSATAAPGMGCWPPAQLLAPSVPGPPSALVAPGLGCWAPARLLAPLGAAGAAFGSTAAAGVRKAVVDAWLDHALAGIEQGGGSWCSPQHSHR